VSARFDVLFVCVHNAGRSRMAEALFNRIAAGRFTARSAGTEPAAHPHPEVVAAMREIGIELEGGPGTLLTQELASDAGRVIGMGCDVEAACPALRVPLEDWELPDPRGQGVDEVAAIRDEIASRVTSLLDEMAASALEDQP